MSRGFLASICLLIIASCTKTPPSGESEGENPYVDKKIYVSSVEELNSVTDLKAGDTIVLASGTYNNEAIAIHAFGASSQPIVFMAAQAGKAILTGKSSMAISGSYVVVSGFWFRDVISVQGKAIIEFRRSVSDVANNCRMTNCAITGKNTLPDKTTDYKWVSLFGRKNQVDNCSFADKRNIGTLMVVWLTSGITPEHLITKNYFSRPTVLTDGSGAEINGQETIRIGDSGSSMQDAKCIVDNNYFYMCNGEIEAISNKSGANVYRGNAFRTCAATLTLRHGNGCLVENNYFIGDGVSNSGGTRVIGENHTVRANYYENLRGSGYRTAICLVRGVPNSELSGYFQVKNAIVKDNVIVNCTNGINVNYGSGTQTEPVVSSVISGNTISNTSSSNVAIQLTSPPTPAVTWSGNIVWGGKYVGISSVTVPTTPTQPVIKSRTEDVANIEKQSGVNWTI